MEKTIASPIADECIYSPPPQVSSHEAPQHVLNGLGSVSALSDKEDDAIYSLDYFAIEGEKARLNLELRARMAHQRADAEGEASA